MLLVKGDYTEAKVFTDNAEPKTIAKIKEFCNYKFLRGSKIAIMPDTHWGNDCVIGTTMTLTGRVIPNLVGSDGGCGVLTVVLKDKDIDLVKLDNVVNNLVPVGRETRVTEHYYADVIDLNSLRCVNRKKNRCQIDFKRDRLSLGTLGGGNHFIEVDKDEDGTLYLVIHSGSRHLGADVNKFYQRLAHKNIFSQEIADTLEEMKKSERHQEIQAVSKELSNRRRRLQEVIPSEIAYVKGQDFLDYIHDINIVQTYATFNRLAIAEIILQELNLTAVEDFTTIHNYIDVENMIMRKGAISAQRGEKVLIPLNMRDGALLCVGKGNPNWNFSAPHGAGRIASRTEARDLITLDEMKDSMRGIYTTSVSEMTLDEAYTAYKPMQEIIDNVRDTVKILKIVKPIFNFKESKQVSYRPSTTEG